MACASLPAAVAGEEPRFRLIRASSPAELRIAAGLRNQIFQERRGLSIHGALEARRDRIGHVFSLHDRATPIAVGRVLPYPAPLSAPVDLSRVAGAHGADSEIGRVASVASSQAPLCALLLLTLGSMWLLENTTLRRYVGYCQPRLLALYRILGATPCGLVQVPGRSEPYCIIGGSYEQAAKLGAQRLGLTQPAMGGSP